MPSQRTVDAQRHNFLAGFEKRYRSKLEGFFLHFETYHLTLMSILWSLLIVFFGILSKGNTLWLLGISLMILLQYLTDYFDGHVGRKKRTGLVKWGYYMDHFLDYIFICSIFFGYLFIIQTQYSWLVFLLLMISGSFMVHTFLDRVLTKVFNVSQFGLGPTEVRIGLILLNIAIIIFGIHLLSWVLGISSFLGLLGLGATLYRSYTTKRFIKGFWKNTSKFFSYIVLCGLFVIVAFMYCFVNKHAINSLILLYIEYTILSAFFIHLMLLIEYRKQLTMKENIAKKTLHPVLAIIGDVFFSLLRKIIFIFSVTLFLLALTIINTYLVIPPLFLFAALFLCNIIFVQSIIWEIDRPKAIIKLAGKSY